jgi:hypothetical protein
MKSERGTDTECAAQKRMTLSDRCKQLTSSCHFCYSRVTFKGPIFNGERERMRYV